MKATVLSILWVSVIASGEILTVSPDDSGDFESIQEAVFGAWHGDTVLVFPGLYEEDVIFGGRQITLTSLDPDDPNLVGSTVINGTVYFDLAETEDARLEGFTILSNAFNATADSYIQEQPALSRPWLLWQDQRSGNKDIYGRNLVTNELLAVCTHSASQEVPDVHGSLAVWQDNRNGNFDIYGKDLDSGQEIPICTHSALQNDPAVYGRLVVWIDFRNSNYDIYGKDLDSGQEIPICTHSANQFNPDVYGNIVVWSDLRNAATGNDIYGKNLTTGQEFEICTAAGAQTRPLIWGNIVVWRDQRNGAKYDIYGKNLTTGEEFEICTQADNQTFLDFSGNLVVWQDDRNGHNDIYGKDLSTGEEFVISAAVGDQTVPVIDGKIIAWQDLRTANAEIYWYDLQYPACLRTVLYGIVCWYSKPAIRNCTILGCGNYGIIGTKTSAPTLTGNTIQYNADGISGCNGTIENNLITNNQYGIFECNGDILYNTIAFNSAYGIESCGEQISHNVIFRNHQKGIVNSNADILNNTIAFNGGDGIVNCPGLVKNNIFAFNKGLGISGACQNSYNAFWQNDAGTLGNGGVPGSGSILVDPLFANIEADDYHLLSEAGRWDPDTTVWVTDSQTSRCIDAGDPADDTQLERNPNGGRINLGAYGGTIETSKSPAGSGSISPCIDPPSMDSNGDCKIDLTDFATFCSQWLACGRDDPAACW